MCCRAWMQLSTPAFVHSFIHAFIHSSLSLINYYFIHSFISLIHSFIRSSIHSSIHSTRHQGDASGFGNTYGRQQVLEINPKHPILRSLWARVQADHRQTSSSSSSSSSTAASEEVVEEIGDRAPAAVTSTVGVVTPATVVIKQLLDSALITAGLVDDPRRMLVQLNELMLAALGGGPGAK